MFWLSAIYGGLTYFELTIAFQWLNTNVTRDFNFGAALLVILGVTQLIVSVAGIGMSVGKK